MSAEASNKVEDLEKQLSWYKATYENRSLFGIVKDVLINRVKIIFRKKGPLVPIQPDKKDENLPPVLKKHEEIITYLPKGIQEKSYTFTEVKKYFYNNDEKPELYKASKPVDIIVPIYNGQHFLEILIPQILANSDLLFNLILINDCSPDKNIIPFLEKFRDNKNITIVHNEVNLGFTGTINKALKLSKNDAVLLNSDTEVPKNWLSRLFNPIFTDPTIATVTPFSNCATICSFPKYDDNEIFEGLSTDKIDDLFQQIVKQPFIEIPTGVGFCMAMSRAAIDTVGLLDEQNFPKGYGEEVDWCRRAIKKGYKNVFIPNLFIYHKHGGSFSSELKKELSGKHQQLVEALHPDFMPDVLSFFENSIQNSIRQFLLLKIIDGIVSKTILYVEHELGGGANIYADNMISKRKEKNLIIRLTYGHPLHNPGKKYIARFYYKDYYSAFNIDSPEMLLTFFTQLKLDEFIIGSLISFQNLTNTIDILIKIAQQHNCKITYLIHDYHSICPQFTLMYRGEKFCNIPDFDTCKTCQIKENVHPVLIPEDYTNLDKYRQNWSNFLNTSVSSIICFSPSSKQLLLKAYPTFKSEKIQIIPHEVKEYRPVNIGIIGSLHSKAKGGEIVLNMARNAEKEHNPNNIRFIVFGEVAPEFDHHLIQKSGTYARTYLYDLIIKNHIDVLFIPSICSETFSYTTAEGILAGLPVFCFDMGGQGDQVRNYINGHIIKEISAKGATDAMVNFVIQKRKHPEKSLVTAI